MLLIQSPHSSQHTEVVAQVVPSLATSLVAALLLQRQLHHVDRMGADQILAQRHPATPTTTPAPPSHAQHGLRSDSR
jgi:hypothetical protein